MVVIAERSPGEEALSEAFLFACVRKVTATWEKKGTLLV
jgi:hypothetical protein